MPQGPHADFTCLSKHCRTEEGAAVYDLPVSATHCPHGHKRLVRIWTPPNVARAHDLNKAVERVGEQAYNEATRTKRAAVNSHPLATRMVPVGQVGATLAGFGVHALPLKEGKATPSSTPATPTLAAVRGRPPRPKVVASYNPETMPSVKP